MTFKEIKKHEAFLLNGVFFIKADDEHADNNLVWHYYIEENEIVEVDEACKRYNKNL